MGYGLKGEESAWLSNFGTNVLEYYKQYNVRLHEGGIANLQSKKENIQQQIAELEKQPADKVSQRLAAAKKLLSLIETAQSRFTTDTYNSLSEQAKELHNKAFITNINDVYYHELETLKYEDKGVEREFNVPKGDVFHQFRTDVKNGTLPTVSWLMPPAHFSDHPGQPWFGPWYVSEAMEILLENPEVWKKTIFIVTYDENDGYFDHMPPYTVPNPYKENTGKVSVGIDPKMDFATKAQQTNPSMQDSNLRDGSIGLGYRVPMIIASPWSRGGFVNSEVFDHTSSLQFLETFLAKKFGKTIREENITEWRRTICGDLTSAFRPYHGEKITKPEFLDRKPFIESIHQAQFKNAPDNYKQLTGTEIAQINDNHLESPYFPKQEKGVRSSCALPYENYSNAVADGEKVSLSFKVGNQAFGAKTAGSPFRVYAMNPYQGEVLRSWDYSVKTGHVLKDQWNISNFENGAYHLRVYAPNGFFREFSGNKLNPSVKIQCGYERARLNPGRLTGNIVVTVTNSDTKPHILSIVDNSYKSKTQQKAVPAGAQTTLVLDLSKSLNWYDFSIKIKGHNDFEERFAGHVETGEVGKTDPLMGGIV